MSLQTLSQAGSSRSAPGAPTSASPTPTPPTARATRQRYYPPTASNDFARLVPSDSSRRRRSCQLHELAGASRGCTCSATSRCSTRRSRSWSPTTPRRRHHAGRPAAVDRHRRPTASRRATPRSSPTSPRERPDAVLLGGEPRRRRRRAVARAARAAAAREAVRAEHARHAGVPRRHRGRRRSLHDRQRGERRLRLGGRRDLRHQPDPRSCASTRRRARRCCAPTGAASAARAERLRAVRLRGDGGRARGDQDGRAPGDRPRRAAARLLPPPRPDRRIDAAA